MKHFGKKANKIISITLTTGLICSAVFIVLGYIIKSAGVINAGLFILISVAPVRLLVSTYLFIKQTKTIFALFTFLSFWVRKESLQCGGREPISPVLISLREMNSNSFLKYGNFFHKNIRFMQNFHAFRAVSPCLPTPKPSSRPSFFVK